MLYLGVLVLLATAVGATLSSAPANAVSPERARVEGTNPTLGQRFIRYSRWVREHGGPPDVLLLGSSRSVLLDPRQVRRLTGRSSFNAGISDANALELRAMVDFADLRSPGQLPHVVLLLDVEAFDDRASHVRTGDYQRRLVAARRACPDLPSCRRDWMRAARRIELDAVRRQVGDDTWLATQRSDGRQVHGMLEKLESRGVDLTPLLRQGIARKVAAYSSHFDRVHEDKVAALDATLAVLNARGVEPVIALTPLHAACIRTCGAAGWHDRRRAVRERLDELAQRREFRLLDLSFPRTWRGGDRFFYDEQHLRPMGAAMVVRRLRGFGAFEAS